MKVTVKRKSSAGIVHRNLSEDKRWRNTGKLASVRSRNQRKTIRANRKPCQIRKGA